MFSVPVSKLALVVGIASSGCGRHLGVDAGPKPESGIQAPSEDLHAAATPATAVFSLPSTDGDLRVDARFAPPAGFARIECGPKSFGAFLRGVPVRPADAPIVDYRGRLLYRDGHHPNVAAVVDLDIGADDLQQCADSVIRLNAEWHYGRGDRDLTYSAAGGAKLGYRRYLAGERVFVGAGPWRLGTFGAPCADTHDAFRRYLDEVFAWANTASLEHEGQPVTLAEALPGDFFVQSGRPAGHAVILLDLAHDASGRSALLLGQGYMPAQSFQVLRASPTSEWFIVEPNASEVATPFWTPFPIRALRRLP